jgi:hypothetical protein
MREEPIISGAWIKAALVVLVAGAIGQQEALTTPPPKPKQPKPAQPAPPPPAGPSIQQLQQLNRCIASAGGDIDRITACFDRFAR